MAKTPQEYCLKCYRNTKLTRHHLKPVRFFGKGHFNPEVATLCKYCHRNLESIIWNFETKTGQRDRIKLPQQRYIDIFLDFIIHKKK